MGKMVLYVVYRLGSCSLYVAMSRISSFTAFLRVSFLVSKGELDKPKADYSQPQLTLSLMEWSISGSKRSAQNKQCLPKSGDVNGEVC